MSRPAETPSSPHSYSHLGRANDLEPSDGHRFLRGCPVHHETAHDPPFFVVSRHADVLDVLKAPETWGNRRGPGVFHQESGVLGSADDPDHRRHRGVLRDAFLPTVIARREPEIAAQCDELWEQAFGRGGKTGEGDFVSAFAFPFPALVIAQVLGVDPADRHRFGSWSAAIVDALGSSDMEAYRAATAAIWDYVDGMVDDRTAALDDGEGIPDDVVSTLTRALRAGELDRGEVRHLAHQLLVAGHETTTSLIGLMLYRLIERPEIGDRLRGRPELLDSAVEEFLRFDSPVQGLFRTSAEAQTLHGVEIPAATKLQVLYASANRDPDAWSDPDELRLDRDPADARQHLAFGWGVHYCIGAPLARLQARHALRCILESFEAVELIGEPELTTPFVLRGFSSLPIRWRTRA